MRHCEIVRSVRDTERIRSFWQEYQCDPFTDIDAFPQFIADRPNILRPHIIVYPSMDHPKAILVGWQEDTILDVRLGYARISASAVRMVTFPHGGFMGEQDIHSAEAMINCIQESLRQREAEVAMLHFLRIGSPLHRAAITMPSVLCRDHAASASDHWLTQLPPTVDDMMNRFTAKRRREFQRLQRNLAHSFPSRVTFQPLHAPHDVPQLAISAEQVARKSYLRGMEKGFRDTCQKRTELLHEAERGWLKGYVLSIDDYPRAFWIGCLYRGTLHLRYTAYDPDFARFQLGTITLLWIMQDMYRHQGVCIDFGFGSAFYKQMFADTCHKESTVHVFGPSVRAVSLNMLLTIVNRATRIGKRAITLCRQEDATKRRWRRRLIPPSPKDGND